MTQTTPQIPEPSKDFVGSPKWVSATLLVANMANVIIVLCSLFALGSILLAPAAPSAMLFRSSLFTALGASAISSLANLLVWSFEKMHPERLHAVQHWLKAHVASISGFVGANFLFYSPPVWTTVA